MLKDAIRINKTSVEANMKRNKFIRGKQITTLYIIFHISDCK